MPPVLPSQARTDKALTNFSLGYFQDASIFIATKILPVFKVPETEKAGDVYSYGKDALRIVDTAKATYGQYNKVNLRVEKTAAFNLKNYGLTGEVFEEDVKFAESPINARIDSTETIVQKLMLDMEQKLAIVATNPSVITQNVALAGADQWDEYQTSDPFADIRAAVIAVKAGSSKRPNTLILGWDVFMTLTDHPLVRAQFPWAQEITKDMLEKKIGTIFGFKNVYIGEAQYNDSNLGATTQDLEFIWSKVAIVAYIESAPKLKSRTLGWTFTSYAARRVRRMSGPSIGIRHQEEDLEDVITVNMRYDQVIVDADCAYLIYDVIA